MTIYKIAKMLVETGTRYAGVRTLQPDENYKVAEFARDSYEWDLEHDCSTYYTTGERAGGTCATDLNTDGTAFMDAVREKNMNAVASMLAAAIDANKIYTGHTQVVLVGDDINTDYQLNDGEIQIVNALVADIVNDELPEKFTEANESIPAQQGSPDLNQNTLEKHVVSLLGRALEDQEIELLTWLAKQSEERSEQIADLLQQVHNMGYERGQLPIDIDFH